MIKKNLKFAKLFKKYRLRSEIETLAEFGDLLAQEGIVYESSIFTRWQNGERVPNERKIILAILKIFIKLGGIIKLEEANLILESLDKSALNIKEKYDLESYLKINNIKTLPINISNFIGREYLIKNITWELIQKRDVLIHGMPGVGKTSLAIHVSHILKNTFTDGIFWFRADVKDINAILDEVLQGLDAINNGLMSIDEKLESMKLLLKDKAVLFIIDNIDWTDKEQKNIIRIFEIQAPKLLTSIQEFNNSNLIKFQVKPYSNEEFLKLSNNILGPVFTETEKINLLQISDRLGNLPITTSIVLKRILFNPLDFKKIINDINLGRIHLNSYNYDSKNLHDTLNYFYSFLQQDEKRMLFTCTLFDGTDFQINSLAKINNFSKEKALFELHSLVKQSLVERSTNKRYRLHPVIKEFMIGKMSVQNYIRLAEHYISILSTHDSGSRWNINYLSKELENIIFLLKRLYANKDYEALIKIWPLISNYVFYSGKWYLMHNLHYIIQDSYIKSDDFKGLGMYFIEDIGRVYFYEGNHVKAKELLDNATKIGQKYKDDGLNGLLKQKLGIICSNNNELDKAEKYLLESIRLLKIANIRKDQLLKSYAYLGMVYIKNYQFDNAINYLQYSLKRSKNLNDESVLGFIYVYLGQAYLQMKKISLAKKYLEMGYSIERKSAVLIGQAMALKGLGNLYVIKKEIDLAQKYFSEAFLIYKSLKMKIEMRQINFEIKKLYR